MAKKGFETDDILDCLLYDDLIIDFIILRLEKTL